MAAAKKRNKLHLLHLILIIFMNVNSFAAQVIIKINETKQISPCPLPQQPLNGRFRIRRQGGVTAIFTCNSGYDLRGFNVSKCEDETRIWSHSPPICVPTKSDLSQGCDEIKLVPETIFFVYGTVTLNCPKKGPNHSILWLKDSSVLSYVVPGITLMKNGSLALSTSDLTGYYTCLTISPTSLRVAASYLVAKGLVEDKNDEPSETIKVTASPRQLVKLRVVNPIKDRQLDANYHHQENRAQSINQNQCGIITTPERSSVSSRRRKRIIDGTRAEKGSAPWMGILATEKNAFICGCSLLNSDWVITAAHCLNSIDESERGNLIVKLGKYIRRQREPGQIVTSVSKIIIHPNFRPRSVKNGRIVVNANDIAMLKLSEAVPSTSTDISPICLPKNGLLASLPSSTLALVTGWGRVSVQQSINAYTLQEAHLPLVDKTVCETSSDYALADGTLCAGYAESYKPDTCDGDSGGPLIVKFQERFHLIGIVSWGQGCSSPGKYGIYTDVEKYLTWIFNVVSEN